MSLRRQLSAMPGWAFLQGQSDRNRVNKDLDNCERLLEPARSSTTPEGGISDDNVDEIRHSTSSASPMKRKAPSPPVPSSSRPAKTRRVEPSRRDRSPSGSSTSSGPVTIWRKPANGQRNVQKDDGENTGKKKTGKSARSTRQINIPPAPPKQAKGASEAHKARSSRNKSSGPGQSRVPAVHEIIEISDDEPEPVSRRVVYEPEFVSKGVADDPIIIDSSSDEDEGPSIAKLSARPPRVRQVGSRHPASSTSPRVAAPRSRRVPDIEPHRSSSIASRAERTLASPPPRGNSVGRPTRSPSSRYTRQEIAAVIPRVSRELSVASTTHRRSVQPARDELQSGFDDPQLFKDEIQPSFSPARSPVSQEISRHPTPLPPPTALQLYSPSSRASPAIQLLSSQPHQETIEPRSPSPAHPLPAFSSTEPSADPLDFLQPNAFESAEPHQSILQTEPSLPLPRGPESSKTQILPSRSSSPPAVVDGVTNNLNLPPQSSEPLANAWEAQTALKSAHVSPPPPAVSVSENAVASGSKPPSLTKKRSLKRPPRARTGLYTGTDGFWKGFLRDTAENIDGPTSTSRSSSRRASASQVAENQDKTTLDARRDSLPDMSSVQHTHDVVNEQTIPPDLDMDVDMDVDVEPILSPTTMEAVDAVNKLPAPVLVEKPVAKALEGSLDMLVPEASELGKVQEQTQQLATESRVSTGPPLHDTRLQLSELTLSDNMAGDSSSETISSDGARRAEDTGTTMASERATSAAPSLSKSQQSQSPIDDCRISPSQARNPLTMVISQCFPVTTSLRRLLRSHS
ncbi:hypothetical protein BV25DRAFT_1516485 [Artomyces pyxidatus]|uniref:Uncharacterized protein n=1 Tax=Artomyces pyxidatus TaxID=48021 RepID=A0ACB8TCT9_9AGAM|nr:hypothetical protein BV25DRAFT_1516485 [Artomyces pyxidatus]